MKRLILVLMSNVSYLAVIFHYLGGYLVVTACYLMVTTGYCSLLVVTVRYRSLLIVPTFSMNVSSNISRMFYMKLDFLTRTNIFRFC